MAFLMVSKGTFYKSTHLNYKGTEMKVLVVDDKKENRESAIRELRGHKVTVVSSFKDAMKKIHPLCRRSEEPPFQYDAVLTDMMLPMSERMLPQFYDPKALVPYGLVIALRAALRGAKYVAMVTDTNHHVDAMSAALDFIDDSFYDTSRSREELVRINRPNFSINGAKVMFVHAPMQETKKGVFVKDWALVFDGLTSEERR